MGGIRDMKSYLCEDAIVEESVGIGWAIVIIFIMLMMSTPIIWYITNTAPVGVMTIQVLDKDAIQRHDSAFTLKPIIYLIETEIGTYETDWDVYRLLTKNKTYVVEIRYDLIISVIGEKNEL